MADIFTQFRLIPRDTEFLNRKRGSRGEIFFNQDTNTLNLYDGKQLGGIPLAKGDLSNVDSLAFKAKADAAGVGGGGGTVEISETPPSSPISGETWLDETTGIFYVYYDDGTSSQWIQPAVESYGGGSGAVSGVSTLNSLSDVVISSAANGQVLKYNGTNWVNAADDTSSAGAVSNSFATVAVAGQSSVIADSSTDTLTLVAGANVTITTDPITDAITIAATSVEGSASNSFTTIAVSGQPSIIADSSIDTLTIAAGTGISVTTNATTDTLTISTSGSTGEANQNAFSNIAVAGQATVVADNTTDTLTLVAGTGIIITTNATTDAVTITSSVTSATTLAALTDTNVTDVTDGQVLKYSTSQSKWIAASDLTATGGTGISLSDLSVSIVTASGGGSLAYNNTSGVFTFTPAVVGVTSVNGTGTVNGITLTGTVTSTGSLTLGGTLGNVSLTSQITGTLPVLNGGTGTTTPSLVAGTNITVTGSWPNQTINSTASAGATTFSELTDNAGLTVDQFYLPAITRLNVTNNGASSYRFDQYGSADNPTLYALNGATIAFNLNVAGHPFLIQTSGGSNYNEGLVHVTTTGVVTTGAGAQGKTSGTLYWKIPSTISGNYRYICSIHGSMVGVITIKDFSVI
jgi:hypothetical protein